MSQRLKTVKLPGYQPTLHPEETPDDDLRFHQSLLTQIVFGLWSAKKDELATRGWPPMPVHQKEVFAEYKARAARYKAMDKELRLKGSDRYWPSHAREHDHNWIERRVNYLATEEYGPKQHGIVMVVNVTAGQYAPNPKLFE